MRPRRLEHGKQEGVATDGDIRVSVAGSDCNLVVSLYKVHVSKSEKLHPISSADFFFNILFSFSFSCSSVDEIWCSVPDFDMCTS